MTSGDEKDRVVGETFFALSSVTTKNLIVNLEAKVAPLWLSTLAIRSLKRSDNHEGDSQRSEREEGGLSLFTFAFMVTNFTPAKAKAHLANRPDLEPCRGMKSSESGTPDAIPSFTNSDPSSWIQEAGHQGARALAPALGVPRRNHLHPKCPSVPPGHLGHQVTNDRGPQA